jgi:hypothetical protein
MVLFADDLRADVLRGQCHLGYAADIVGDALSLVVHGGLEVGEHIPIFEPLKSDILG